MAIRPHGNDDQDNMDFLRITEDELVAFSSKASQI